jgi:methionine sulfoxide reductase heme-binding subunit
LVAENIREPQVRRFFLNHVPLALASAGLLALFMTASTFEVSRYQHADLVSGRFPRVRTEEVSAARVRGQGADSTAGANERHDSQADHHGGQGGAMRHAGRDAARPRHTGANSSTDNHTDVARSRTAQQFTVASGYLALALLAVTLLLGPVNLILRRRNPISTYLRRDVGIWTAVFSLVHVIAAALIHVSHGSTLSATVLHFFVAEDGPLLTNSFGLGNWMGLAAVAIALALLATSSDIALRTLKAKRWKWIQRLNYAVFALVILHAFFYGAFLRMHSPFTRLLVLSVAVVCIGQTVGIWLWRRRHLGGPAVA